MEFEHIDIDRLIVRYKSGDSNVDETTTLLNWIRHSEENRAYFQEIVALVDTLESGHISFDEEKAFDSFLQQTTLNQNTLKKSIFLNPYLRIAASVLIILSIGLSTLLYLNRDVNEIVVTSRIEVLNQDLPDNSNVALNKGSQITYPSRFVEDNREVEIKGHAFFDVKHKKRKPFIVYAGPVQIEVLGTSFDVLNDTILKVTTVTVESGKVKVSYPENNFIAYLNPKEQCVINWGEKSVSENVLDNDNYKAWLTKVLVFDSAPLHTVIRNLNAVYDKKIIIADNDLKNCMLTTKLDNTPQNEVLSMLEKSLNLEVIDNGEMYILIGEGCPE